MQGTLAVQFIIHGGVGLLAIQLPLRPHAPIGDPNKLDAMFIKLNLVQSFFWFGTDRYLDYRHFFVSPQEKSYTFSEVKT